MKRDRFGVAMRASLTLPSSRRSRPRRAARANADERRAGLLDHRFDFANRDPCAHDACRFPAGLLELGRQTHRPGLAPRVSSSRVAFAISPRTSSAADDGRSRSDSDGRRFDDPQDRDRRAIRREAPRACARRRPRVPTRRRPPARASVARSRLIDEHAARRGARHGRADASKRQPARSSQPPRPDHDHRGVPLAGLFEERLRGRAFEDRGRGGPPGLVELLLGGSRAPLPRRAAVRRRRSRATRCAYPRP